MPLPPFPPAPKPGDSNLDHALLYHSLGWWVFPGRSPLDVAQFRQYLLRQGKSHEAAFKDAERARKHTFINWAERREQGAAGRPTEAEIREWFEHEPLRPVIVLTGPGTTFGGQLVGVDVDTLKGGDAAPWIGSEVTMLARTPNLGWHAYHLADDAEALKTNAGDVAEGIDIRAAGGLLVAPSGEEATPGRIWERWGGLSPAPVEEIRQRLSARNRGRILLRVQTDDPDAIPDAPPARGFVAACSERAPDGSRQRQSKVLIGMLAASRALPGDAVDAAIGLLAEDAERTHAAEVVEELAEGWRDALESTGRSLVFALKVLRAWNRLRADPPWPADKLEETTRSQWNTALSRELAAASAARVQVEEPETEDTLEAVQVDDVADVLSVDASETEGAAVEEGSDEPDEGVFQPPTPEQIQAQEAAKMREEIEIFAPMLGDSFTLENFDAVQERAMIPCGVLPPWREVLQDGSVVPVANTPSGHGFGEAMDDIIGGGLKPGFMAAVGAEAAKFGKTAFMDQWMDGLLLRSAEVLAKLARDEETDEPIIVRWDLSEMNSEDLTMRQLGRWLGIDSTAFRRGRNGHKAPGIRAVAAETGEDPVVVINRYRAAARSEFKCKTGPLYMIREGGLRRIVNPRTLLGRNDVQDGKPQDHRRGVLLLKALALAVAGDRKARALEWKVPEKQVIPLIFIDPIQRFQSTDGDAVAKLDELVEELRAIADELGAIVFCTSDTNKESAKAPANKPTGPAPTPAQIAAGVFRGSYKLLHLPDVAFVLRAVPDSPQMELLVGINRWNGQTDPIRLDFDRRTGRYTPARASGHGVAPWENEVPASPPAPSPAGARTTLLEAGLTSSEVEVALLVGQGKTNREIAAARGCADSTVDTHIKRSRDKLGVFDRNALAAFVEGLTQESP